MERCNFEEATTESMKRWSPVWIIPVVTLLIGGWILFYHFSHQGPLVYLYTSNAEGIEGGKTSIKSRNVEVGIVESAILTDDLHDVKIAVRLHSGMEKLLKGDTAFWTVKPTIGREGISGLGTLLSGAFIELRPGTKGEVKGKYALLDSPPLASPDAKGIHIILYSEKAGQLNPGDPVLFRGYEVGSVETSNFDTEKRMMSYQIFIHAPYDKLVTSNVRFWKDSGIAVDMSASGMRVEMGSLTTLFSGGVSFDVAAQREAGDKAEDNAAYKLFDNQHNIQDSLYTLHKDILMFFNDSVRGLQPGAPVEFRGIRLGTVAQVPFISKDTANNLNNDYRIPVLIRLDLERMPDQGAGMEENIKKSIKSGLRASLKTGNLLTGSLYVDLDFYDHASSYKGPTTYAGYELIPTVSGGLTQIQQKLTDVLDKVNDLPLNPMVTAATGTLQESQRTLREMNKTLDNINQLAASPAMKQLPAETQATLRELNRTIKGFQPGSPAYVRLVSDMQRLDQVMREIQPLLKILNGKSNALVFEAKPGQDPQPQGKK